MQNPLKHNKYFKPLIGYHWEKITTKKSMLKVINDDH